MWADPKQPRREVAPEPQRREFPVSRACLTSRQPYATHRPDTTPLKADHHRKRPPQTAKPHTSCSVSARFRQTLSSSWTASSTGAAPRRPDATHPRLPKLYRGGSSPHGLCTAASTATTDCPTAGSASQAQQEIPPGTLCRTCCAADAPRTPQQAVLEGAGAAHCPETLLESQHHDLPSSRA